MLTLSYVVDAPGDNVAGLRSFTEDVDITFQDGDYTETPEMVVYFRNAIAEWFDVSPKRVHTLKEYTAMVNREMDWPEDQTLGLTN